MGSMTAKLVANTSIVLREESDSWALLYDPDTGSAYGLNPVGVIIWKHLDGMHDADGLVEVLRLELNAVPEDVKAHVETFLDDIQKRALASPGGQVV